MASSWQSEGPGFKSQPELPKSLLIPSQKKCAFNEKKGVLEVERAKIFVARTDTGSFKPRPGTKRGSDLNRAMIFWPELLLVCLFM